MQTQFPARRAREVIRSVLFHKYNNSMMLWDRDDVYTDTSVRLSPKPNSSMQLNLSMDLTMPNNRQCTEGAVQNRIVQSAHHITYDISPMKDERATVLLLSVARTYT